MPYKPRTGVVLSVLVRGTLAALVGMTAGCSVSSPIQPTPTHVTAALTAPATVELPVVSLTTDRNLVAPGAELSVSWTASRGGHNDWVALFENGDPNTGRSRWVGWTDGAASGTFTLTAPVEPGQYEFRYLPDDGYLDAARSSLTVR